MTIYGDWAKKAAGNAVRLAQEARLLQSHDHLERAYYLAHMSAEESSKAIVLAGAHLKGIDASQLSKITRLLRDHKKKIGFTVQVATESSPDLAESLREHGDALIDHINNLKNDTMYTTISGTAVVTPQERIRSVDVNVHIDLATSWAEQAAKISSAC